MPVKNKSAEQSVWKKTAEWLKNRFVSEIRFILTLIQRIIPPLLSPNLTQNRTLNPTRTFVQRKIILLK